MRVQLPLAPPLEPVLISFSPYMREVVGSSPTVAARVTCNDVAQLGERLLLVWSKFGVVAQLGEHLSGRQEVAGSIPVDSTKIPC